MKNFLTSKRVFKNFERSFYIALFALSFLAGTIVYAQTSDLQQITQPAPIQNIQVPTMNTNVQDAGLSNPTPANAQQNSFTWQALTTTYQLICYTGVGPDALCQPERQNWSVSLALIDLFTGSITRLVCDGKSPDEVIKNVCLTTGDFAMLQQMNAPNDNAYYRMPGGLSGYLALNAERVTTEPITPTNLALFFKDSTKDTLIGEPAYAATVWDASFESIVLGAWKVTRNISLGLLGAVIGISALMVMFRAQMGPRSVVTIYNVLPAIPLTLGLILFSYPIAALILGLITPLTQFSMAFGKSLIATVPGTGFGDAVGLGSAAVSALVAIVAGFSTITGGFLAGVILLGVIILLWVWVMIAYIIMTARILISMIINTIAAPLVILMSALPGRNGLLLNLAKSFMADLITLPAFNIVYYLGLAIIAISPQGGHLYLSEPMIGLGVVSFKFIIFWLKLFMGFGLIWSCRNMRNNIRTQLGVNQNLFGGGGGDERRR